MVIGFDFCMTGYFYLSGENSTTLEKVEVPARYRSLEDAIQQAKEMIDVYNCEEVACCDGHTGEVIFIARAHDDECVEDLDDEYWDDGCPNEDCGFNPYMGCYDYDC